MKKSFAAFGLPALGLVFALAACATEQAPPPAHTVHAPPPKIQLDVQAINLADRSGLQPVSSPYNVNRFSPTISDAIKQWAGDRLQAAGSGGQAIIVIKDASLIAQPMATRQGIDGWFSRDQGEKYIARAEVSIEANGHQGFAMADAVATRAITLPENPTPIERQDAYYTLLTGMMKDLGQNLEIGVQTHMSNFIVTPQVYGVTAVPTGDSYSSSSADDLSPVIIQSPTGAPAMGSPMAAPVAPAPIYATMSAPDLPSPIVPTPSTAVAAATVQTPSPVAVSPPTMLISQSGALPAAAPVAAVPVTAAPVLATPTIALAPPTPAPVAQPIAPPPVATYYPPQVSPPPPPAQIPAPVAMTAPTMATPAPAMTAQQAPLPLPPPPAPVAAAPAPAPVLGNVAVPTVSQLASAPSSFGQPQPQPAAATGEIPPPPPPSAFYSVSSTYAAAPAAQQPAPSAPTSYLPAPAAPPIPTPYDSSSAAAPQTGTYAATTPVASATAPALIPLSGPVTTYAQ